MADGLLGFFSGLGSGMMSPLFQSGAAMYNAGANGQNFGGGLMAGAEAASTASKNLLAQTEAQRKLQQQQQRDQMWGQIMGGKPPPWAASLPPGSLELARALGPDAGSQLIAGMIQRGPDVQMARERVALAKAAEARAAAMHPEQLALARAQAAAAGKKDEIGDMIAGVMRDALAPPAAAPATPPATPPAGPGAGPGVAPPVPGVAPMSAPGPAADPAFIRTVGPEGPPAASPAAPAAAPVPTVKVFGRDMPIDKAAQLGQAFMLDPARKDLGKLILQEVEKKSTIGKEISNDLDKKLLAATDSLSRLNTISSTFKPEYLDTADRLGYAWTDFMTRWKEGREVVTPEQQKSFAEYTAFRAEATRNINDYIKEITGAAMSNEEAKRLMLAMPNAGSGIFDGDSPPAFKSKLDTAIYNSKLAIARYNYLKNRGFDGNADEAARRMTLDKVPDVLNRRGKEIRGELERAYPTVRPEALRPLVDQALKKEFGIDI